MAGCYAGDWIENENARNLDNVPTNTFDPTDQKQIPHAVLGITLFITTIQTLTFNNLKFKYIKARVKGVYKSVNYNGKQCECQCGCGEIILVTFKQCERNSPQQGRLYCVTSPITQDDQTTYSVMTIQQLTAWNTSNRFNTILPYSELGKMLKFKWTYLYKVTLKNSVDNMVQFMGVV